MAGSTFTTGATLRAILCFIDAQNTPKIAFDRDDLAIPLAEKIKNAVGDRDGSQSVCISFGYDEAELERQFVEVCGLISDIFGSIHHFHKD